MTFKRIKGIYLIERIIELSNDNEPQYYVGQASDIFCRWEQHCTNSEQYIDKEIQKYGCAKFIFRILEVVSKDSKLNLCETKWIEFYRNEYKEEKMYNISQTKNSNPYLLSEKIKNEIKDLFKQDIGRSIYAISEFYNIRWKDVTDIRKLLLKSHGLKYDMKQQNIVNIATGKIPSDWRGNQVPQSLIQKIVQFRKKDMNNKDIAKEANISKIDLEIFLDEYYSKDSSEYIFAEELTLTT